MIYLAQISSVARHGYLLSDLQERQARLDRENELLAYRLDTERTLARAGEIAGRDYRMQPFSGAPSAGSRAGTAPVATAGASASPRPGPQARFITVRRSAAPSPVPAPPAAPLTLVDRLWNGIVGLGTARAEGR